MKIKHAVNGDEKLVLEYIKKLAAYEKLEDQVTGTEEDVVDNIINNPSFNALLLTDDNDEVVGFSVYFLNFSTFQIKPGIYIEDIYIEEEHRSKGYGLQLFDYYKQLAKTNGYGRIEWICLDWNTDAIDFYENKLGAQSMDGWTIRRLSIEGN